MKKKFLSFLLLLLLNFNIFYTIGFSQSINNEIMDDYTNILQERPYFDVEREIRPIEDSKYSIIQNNFNPGPLNSNNVSADLSLSQKVQSQSTIINIDLERQVVSPGTPLNYVIQVTKGLEPVPGETLDLDIIRGEYWGWYFRWLEEYIPYEDRIISSELITTGSDGEYQGQFNPPSTGRYSIVVRSSSGYYIDTRSFTVANIGLFWRVSSEFVRDEHHYSVAYVLSTSDFSPIAGAEIELSGVIYDYNYSIESYEVQTEDLFTGISNDQGIVEIDFIPPSSISDNYNFLANLSASYNDETVYVSRDIYRGGYYWGRDGYTEYQKYEFIVTTDKPIYSPGETIQARILLWENDYLKVTKEPAQTSFILKFLSPSQHILLHRQVTTDSHGIATYSFTLDTESELGSYYIVTQKEDLVSSVSIRVDKYEKPSFRVGIGLNQEYVAPGNIVSGNVTAEYYFGKPVSGAEVELAIADLDVLSGTTDIDGYWDFKYRLPSESSLEGISEIPINVTVKDTVDREVSSSTVVQITDKVYVWAYVNPWFPKLEENITVYFGAYQYSNRGWYWWDWRPLTNAEVDIKIYGVISDTNYKYITTFESKTDLNGQGMIEFNLPTSVYISYHRFKGLVEVNAGDGREESSTFYFTVDRNALEVDLDPRIYEAGETIEFKVAIRNVVSNTLIAGSLQLRIFDSDYDLIGEVLMDVSSQGSVINFHLTSYAPNGKYFIYCYLETIFDSEYGSWRYYRYSETVEFHVGSANEISLTPDKSSYALTDSLTISGQIQGQTNIPIMIQFIKKGIVITEYIDVSSVSDFNIEIENIYFLAPRCWVYAFAILNDGTILETSLDIEIDASLLVEINSDKSVYEPGDQATVIIKVYDANHQPVPTVLVVSFIDSSVFGVQADPETEQEHFQDQEYWPSVWTVVSWKNQQRYWWFWWYDLYPGYFLPFGGYRGYYIEDDIFFNAEEGEYQTPLPPSATKNEEIADSSPKKRDIRDNLPENAYWSPNVIVEDGQLEIELPLPDTIGEWTVRVVATTDSGKGVLSKYSFKTFLPFFVEINKEPFVLQDEVFVLKGIVYNYLEALVNITLELETESGILTLGRNTQSLMLPSGFLGSIGWSCLAQDIGIFNVTLYGDTTMDATRYEDAIRKPLEIIPNGVTSDFKTSGFISSDPSFSYIRYSESVQQSEFLELSLGLGSIALTSWERLLNYPYGCTEQTISCLIPDALILKYLEKIDQLTDETEEIIRDMVVSGLSRIYSQQHRDGGWGWWHDDSSRVYMTSLVLYGLGIVNKSGFYIDPNVVSDAIDMLRSHQNQDGSWTPDSWRGIDQTSFTGFVLRSILQWVDVLDSTTTITDAVTYISAAWNDIDKRSTYLAGLYLDSVPGSGFGQSSFEITLLNYLKNEVRLSSIGYYWTYSSDEHYWRALGGDVEITALALKGLVVNDPAASMPIIRSAIQWLLQRQSWYGWGNTADTVAAISTIIALSESEISSDEDAKVTLVVNDNLIENYSLSTSSQPTYYIDLERYLRAGENHIELMKEGLGNVSYYFHGNQILRSLPSISLPTKLSSYHGQQVTLPVTMIPISSNVFAYNLSIVPLDGELTPTINQPYSITHLTQQTEIRFNYNSPSQSGIYEIPGFEISYQLSNGDLTQFSPGIITRKYGPVQLEVSNPAGGIILGISSVPINPLTINIKNSKLKTDSSTEIELDRSYSKVNGLKKGELIYVTLTVNNYKEVENFLMLEDNIPIGFELDENTIKHLTGTYQITATGITFFFPELKIGSTEIKYGLVVMNVRQSLVSPAKLSSMYDDWVESSSAEILGDTRVPIDPSTGAVIKDLQIPILESIILEETLLASKGVLDIEVTASDNWGIASVRVFIKQSSWKVFECSEDQETWKVLATGLNDGESQIYLEIIDLAGNVLVTESFKQFIEIEDLVVPVFSIIGLIIVATITGTSASLIVRKRFREQSWR
ncbi:MAG: MG2 domain-containing protein [Promethearchaeota archaeon]